MKSVYLETTIPSYLAAFASRDLVIAAHQQITHQWWNTSRHIYSLFVSDLVLDEIKGGDVKAAGRRRAFIENVPRIVISKNAYELGKIYVESVSRLHNAHADAIHLAAATLNAIDYVVSWNLKHIVHAEVQSEVHVINELNGMRTPVICTPEELLQ